ncbi:twin-arginine translocase subunit TatC [Stetteria hydrogenophila]
MPEDEELPEEPLWDHVVELSIRLKRILTAVFVAALVLSALPYSLSPYIPLVNALPRLLLERLVPQNVTFMGRTYTIQLAQYSPFAGFNILFQSTILLGVLGASPVIARELIAYIGPALYKHEREALKKYSLVAIGLFALGVAIAYFIFIPWVMRFLFIMSVIVAGNHGLVAFSDIGRLFTLIVKLLIATGVMFEIPLVIYILIVYEIVGIEVFKGNGMKYAFIASLILGAIISPDPTGLGMLMLAIPYYLLLVAAVKLGERNLAKKKRASAKAEGAERAVEAGAPTAGVESQQ